MGFRFFSLCETIMNNKRRRQTAADDVKKIRNLFKIQSKPLNAYLITSYDQHNNDASNSYHGRRLEFITNFSGGTGNAIISDSDARLWVDDDAAVRAAEEVIEPFQLMTPGDPDALSESEWLIKSLPYGGVVGACGRYVPVTTWLAMATKLEFYDIHLVDVGNDLIEEIWIDRPLIRFQDIFPYTIHYSGKTAQDKINIVRSELTKRNIDLLVVTELDEIAWVLNLRGRDFECTPVFFAFLIIDLTHLHMFVNDLSEDVTKHLFNEGIRLCEYEYDQFYTCLAEMASCTGNRRVWISDRANYHVYSSIPKRKVFIQMSPIALEKCIKNDEEAHGMIEAHVYDGYAMCKFFSWLARMVKKRNPAPTEVSAAEMLVSIKSQNSDYLGPSCPTISASGTNSSIVRHHAQHSVSNEILANDIYVCETGSQYLTGTTAISRTYCFGKATDFQKECYTRVVKGIINLGTTLFPMNTRGCLLDALARQALWKVGMDYNHGSGHGIGAYLSSVEGPIGINRRRRDDVGLLPNMFVTVEPAYYKKGAFGIRLGDVHHLILSKTSYGDNLFLMPENITLVPYQSTMLLPSLLSTREIDYVNAYHLKIRNILAPVYKSENSTDELHWLMKMTEPLVY